MIIEPTGWAIQCDRRCGGYEDDFADESEARAEARTRGWIFLPGWDFCSLDCLLIARRHMAVRKSIAILTAEHMATHADRCCRLHRTHATRGRHHWADCVDPKRAGVSVL